MKSKIIAVIIALLALGWIGSGIMEAAQKSSPQDKTAKVAAPKKLTQVRVREISSEPFTDVIIVTGRTQASRLVVIRAETEGQVLSVAKQEGEAATKGEILAKLDVRDRTALVREAKGRVAQRRIEYNAASKLADKGFNSKVRLAQTEADLENAKAMLKTAGVDLARIKITAPFAGTIFEQNIEVGDFLSVGDPIFTLVDLDPIEITGFLSERRIKDLELGMSASAEFLDGETIKGNISYIAPAADPNTRTFRIQISTPNKDDKIKDGMTAKISIPLTNRQAHKISPSILSLNDKGQIGVKTVDKNNVVHFVPVKILADKTDAMWVSGLPEAARVITVGQDYVRDAQHVKAVLKTGEGLL